MVTAHNIAIGNSVLMGPNVTICTVGYPANPELRTTGQMYAFPVVIEEGVWIGSGAIINLGYSVVSTELDEIGLP